MSDFKCPGLSRSAEELSRLAGVSITLAHEKYSGRGFAHFATTGWPFCDQNNHVTEMIGVHLYSFLNGHSSSLHLINIYEHVASPTLTIVGDTSHFMGSAFILVLWCGYPGYICVC